MLDFGLAPEAFREEILESRPLLCRRALRSSPFSWAELDAALHRVEPAPPVVELYDGGPVPIDQFTEVVPVLGMPRRRFDKRRLHARLLGGATLVVNRFEHYSLSALALCNEVRTFVGMRTASNAYLSVGGLGTFGPHWDTHDVFAIQLIGTKRWRVYPPTLPLPLQTQTSPSGGEGCPSTPILECVLERGDVLYVPRGFWHHVIPTRGLSLHLSVGTYAPTVHDLILWACERRLPAALAVRRTLSPAIDRAALEEALRALADVLLAQTTREDFERELADGERLSSALDMELLARGGELPAGSRLRVNLTRVPKPEQAEVSVNGKLLRMHPLPRAIVAALAAGPLPIEVLCERLPSERPAAIRAAVTELLQLSIVTIERS